MQHQAHVSINLASPRTRRSRSRRVLAFEIDQTAVQGKTLIMRIKAAISTFAILVLLPSIASASLPGKEDFSEPRVVAVSLDSTIGLGPWANASGYLYSSRIVFSAGHLKDHTDSQQFFVAAPNSKLKNGIDVVSVEKVLYPNTYKTKVYKDDFAILILEKPLVQLSNAPLITPELLAQAIADKAVMKVFGYGMYEDNCLKVKKSPPCQSDTDRTSLVPRSTTMTPWNAAEIQSKFNAYSEEIADHLYLTAPYKGGPCGGDSGGPTTVNLNGINFYVGTVPSGFWNAYACGQSPGSSDRETLGYTAPVYKFLDLIAEAEKYVAEHPYLKPAPKPSPSIVVSKNKYQYISDLAKAWAAGSTNGESALKQCTSARDTGLVYKKGKATALGSKAAELRRDLKTYPGFKACLDGFNKR